MNISFKIHITNNYTIQCSIIDSEQKETIIQLQGNSSQEYFPTLSFSDNTISICEEKDNQIQFLQQWFQQPNDYSTYTILFQRKEYQLLPEVLFALVINEFKNQIEKQFIIKNTIIELPINNSSDIILQRIKISLQSIHLQGIQIDEKEIDYDYQKQGEQLIELLEKKNEYEKYQRIIERAKRLTESEQQKLKLEESQKRIHSEETFYQEMIQQFTTKERSSMKLSQLDNYCLFITSRYFNSLEDHKNFTQVATKLKFNMEKFYYNPISLTEQTSKLFPNVETHHIYNENDKYLKGGRIQRYVDWNRKVPYHEMEKVKEEKFNGKEIEFKRFIWTQTDTSNEVDKQRKGDLWKLKLNIQIPKIVREIDDDAFQYNCRPLANLYIPPTVEYIPKLSLCYSSQLTNITFPLKENNFSFGSVIFENDSHFKQLICLPSSI